MKNCTRCGELKPADAFQVRRASKDGLTASCKACLQKYDRSRANQPHRVAARVEYQKRRSVSKHTSANRRWRKRNKDKQRAHARLAYAVSTGAVVQEPCAVCQTTENVQGHHEDYSKPLAVVWLCPKHHAEYHKVRREVDRTMSEEAA